MQGKSLLKHLLFSVLILEIVSATEKKINDEAEEAKQQTPNETPKQSVTQYDDEDNPVDETQEQRQLETQAKSIQRYEDLQAPTEIEGVPLVKPEIQKPAEENQKKQGTTAHINIGNIVQNQLEKILDKKKDGEGGS